MKTLFIIMGMTLLTNCAAHHTPPVRPVVDAGADPYCCAEPPRIDGGVDADEDVDEDHDEDSDESDCRRDRHEN